MDGSPDGDLAYLIVLLLASAFFSGSEAAFLALSRTRVRQMQEQGLLSGRLLAFMLQKRAIILSVLLLGITLCNYSAERLATLLFVEQLGAQWGAMAAVFVMTLVIVIFCEVVPIQIGAAAPEWLARAAAFIIAPLSVLAAPLMLLLSYISRGILYVFGVRTGSLLPGLSEDHFKAMIEQSAEQGVVDDGERKMLHGVLDFGDRTAAQIMTPRPDVVAIAAERSLAEALELGLSEHHSRLPVYQETIDNIIGILHLKDVLPYVLTNELDKEVRRVARPAHHVPEYLPADELLRQMQARRAMMAIVKDEYGGTAGIVTIEDILEEIVGEIADEYDEEEPEIIVAEEGVLLCAAHIGLHQLEPYVTQELPTEEYDSLGGLVLDLAGRVPQQGESFEWQGLRLTVEAVQGPRIERIRVERLPRSLEEKPQEAAHD